MTDSHRHVVVKIKPPTAKKTSRIGVRSNVLFLSRQKRFRVSR